jgi:hypothetical protein
MTELTEFDTLERAGKIHQKLLIRLRLLWIICSGTAGVLIYDISFKNLKVLPALGFVAVGFGIGYYVFSRMRTIVWDEEKEAVAMERFDIANFVLLCVYVLYRVSVDKLLSAYYHDAVLVSGFSIAVLFGGMMGRLVGMMRTVNRVHRATEGDAIL